MQKTDQKIPQPASPLWRRTMATMYDTFAAIDHINARGTAGSHTFRWYFQWMGAPHISALLACCRVSVFGWFWIHDGQTLSMRSWRLQLVDTNVARQCDESEKSPETEKPYFLSLYFLYFAIFHDPIFPRFSHNIEPQA